MMLHTCAVCTPLSAQAAKILRGAGACSRRMGRPGWGVGAGQGGLLARRFTGRGESGSAGRGMPGRGAGALLENPPHQSSMHLPPRWRPGRAGAAAEGRAGSGAGKPGGELARLQLRLRNWKTSPNVNMKTGVCDVTALESESVPNIKM
jgi:hypothetical protein